MICRIAVVAGLFGGLALSTPAAALCTSYPNTLTNGTTADGGQVMANFNCAALTSGATLNGTTFTGVTAFPGSTVLDASGNLGVGVTPTTKLDVGGAVASGGLVSRFRNATASGYSSLRLFNDQNSTVRTLEINYAGSTYAGALVINGPTGEAGSIATTGAYPLLFATNNTLAGMFGTDRSFLIGTTSNGGWTGANKAEVRNSSHALSVYTTGTSGNALNARVDATGAWLEGFYYSTTNVGSITTTGTATAFNTTSDARLKDTSVAQHDYRDGIERLWVGNFKWKKDGSDGFGIVAQQAYTVFPFAIHKPANESDIWQADYSKLAPLALWGVKDLYRLQKDQAAEIEQLKRTLKSMRQVNDLQMQEIRRLDAALIAGRKVDDSINSLKVNLARSSN